MSNNEKRKGIMKRPREDENQAEGPNRKRPTYPVLDYHLHPENYAWRWRNRSTEPITRLDLKILLDLAWKDFNGFVARNPKHRTTGDRLLAICLCQGAALHFCNGANGIRDFDIYFFFKKPNPPHTVGHPYPTRRKGNLDFGASKFGTTDSTNHQDYQGRIIDIFGRDLHYEPKETYCQTIKRYLHEERTPTAHYLAQKAVVVLHPTKDMGKIIWHNKNYKSPYTRLINEMERENRVSEKRK